MNQEEIDEMERKALEQLRSGQPLLGKGGAFAPLLKSFLEKATFFGKATLQHHL